MGGCPFCRRLVSGPLAGGNALAAAFEDAFPVSPGHHLIVPRRHEASLGALTEAEQSAIWALAWELRERIAAERSPDGFNIGINDGPAAGQTVPHVHLHLIPRNLGDVGDPRGGVRWVVPARAAYWEREQGKP